MAKRKKPTREAVEQSSFFSELSPHAKQAIAAVLVAVVGVFFLAALFEFGGLAGTYVKLALVSLFGHGAYLAPLVCAVYVYTLLNPTVDERISVPKVIGIALLFLASLGGLHLYTASAGGWVGLGLAWPLTFLL